MSKSKPAQFIRLHGVRHNNLKNFDLDLPLGKLIVITGLSGSGKSSLAFDTLFAEGQRRYIETFSPYARQFFDRMDKPQVDRIDGIPPAIAIEQRNTVKTTRSTVGTMTEICDHIKVLWPHVSRLFCRQCGQLVRKDTPQQIWATLMEKCGMQNPECGMEKPRPTECSTNLADQSEIRNPKSEILITFDLPLSEKLSLSESLALVAKQGYQRLLLTCPIGPAPAAERCIPKLLAAAEGGARTVPVRSTSERGAAGELVAPSSRFAHAADGGPSALRQQLRDAPAAARADLNLELNEAATPYRVEPGPSLASGFEILRLEEAAERLKNAPPKSLTVIQDRITLRETNRARFVEACEQAYHFGKGKLTIRQFVAEVGLSARITQHASRSFSNRYHCAPCDLEYREPTSALFSYNNPVGACPTCKGFGRTITIDYNLVIPDSSKTLAEGLVKPWQTGHGMESQQDLMKFCKQRKVNINVPFEKLSLQVQAWVIDGDPGYGKGSEHEWPRAWYGVKGYFRWLESKSYKMHYRVFLSRYRTYQTCPSCQGKRFQPEALLFRVVVPATVPAAASLWANLPSSSREKVSPPAHTGSSMNLADFYQLPIRDALTFIVRLAAQYESKFTDPLAIVLNEIRSRLGYLVEVGLGYLTLERPTRSLSGGETERVNLTTCLGTRLVNTLFVLDEPSVGLHPRDTARLVRVLKSLRDIGNTVVVVEHEANVIRAADQIVDLGPGSGEAGGRVVFQGTGEEILRCANSLTGQYLSGKRRVEPLTRRPVTMERGGLTAHSKNLVLAHATLHNLKNLTVEIPLGRFVCVTGVSGSGKTTLVREVLHPLLEAHLKSQITSFKSDLSENEDEDDSRTPIANRQSAILTGSQHLGRVVLVDQSPLGKTPRSNPAVYIGAFDDLRELFAQTEMARQRGLNASSFSFNSREGQCERCRGAGFEKIEMQFLSDVFIRCPDCNGRRYRAHILEVKLCVARPKIVTSESVNSNQSNARPRNRPAYTGSLKTDSLITKHRSIADLLESTIDDAITFLSAFSESRPAERAIVSLKLLQEVGLGYLRLGQPINTLSGGESQRLKLVSHLAEFSQANHREAKPTLFLFDEPTTGLHFDDVRVLLQVFQRLVEAGHSVVVIEHNLDVIKAADWVIDLGPEAGDEGGRIVAQGTPEQIAACSTSHTGQALREVVATE